MLVPATRLSTFSDYPFRFAWPSCLYTLIAYNSEMATAPMTVVETPFFLRKAASLLDEEERLELVAFLGMNPEAGEVVPEAGGVRKVRWAARGKGKRGGSRVIYYFHSETLPLFLLTIYSKTQKANLTKAERNEFRKLIPLLVKTYARGRKR